MRDRASRYLAMMISLLLLAAVPARAGSISFYDVTVSGGFQSGGQDLRLRTVSGTSGASTQTDGSSTTSTSSSLISTATAPQEGPGAVETIEQGDISGTICDCGEIIMPTGGIPWLPFLAGIPAVCLTGICRDSSNQCIPGTPDCPGGGDTPIPEPASLLLLGSGLAALGASARRRFRRQAEGAANQTAIATEV